MNSHCYTYLNFIILKEYVCAFVSFNLKQLMQCQVTFVIMSNCANKKKCSKCIHFDLSIVNFIYIIQFQLNSCACEIQLSERIVKNFDRKHILCI